MSLDIWLTAVVEHEVVERNITHNLTNMWREAGIYDALYNSEGRYAAEILPTLEAGLELMAKEPSRFKEFDATNGWGTYEQALPWLADLVEQFKKYPQGKIGISR